MRKWLVSVVFAVSACGDCDDSVEPDPMVVSADTAGFDGANASDAADFGDRDSGEPDAGSGLDADSDAASVPSDAGQDTADVGEDAQTDSATPVVCGDGQTQGPEVCDDGNTVGDDYCAADCSAVTGRCGDGVLQGNETCDDATTADCAANHDGGDGACVAVDRCSAGYTLDGGECVPTNTTGLTRPCTQGDGYTLFKFHYDNGSTSARIDVWDASCSYSFAQGSACNVVEVYPGFGSISRTSEGYPIVTSTHYIRARFSANGLNFSQATLHVQGRSYSTGSSTQIRAWSPLYGERYGGPVDNDFVYDWYAIDWTGLLYPSDQASLTAVQLYAFQGSSSLAIKAVELCVQ